MERYPERLELTAAESERILKPKVGRPPDKPVVWFKGFLYQAASCSRWLGDCSDCCRSGGAT